MTVSRVRLDGQKFVYFIVAKKKLPYKYDKSRIVYIGTTTQGMARIATSAAAKAEAILSHHGIDSFEVKIVTCRPRQNVKTWIKLERAFLLTFREKFGEIPKYNSHGARMRWTDELKYFTRSRLEQIITELS